MAKFNLDQVAQSQKIAAADPVYQKYVAQQKADAQFVADQWAYQHGLKLPTSAKLPSMEQIVRPFLLIDSQPPAAPAQQALLPGEGDEAFISWGRPSNFIRPPTDPLVAKPDDPLYDQMGGGIRITNPKGNNKPEEAYEIGMIEIRRETETVKVYDPDDNTVWVEVKRITKIWFRNDDDGNTYRFELKKWTDA